MYSYLTILFGLISFSISGQTRYEIKGFSEKYSGVLTIEEGAELEMYQKGEISILKTDTKESVLTFKSEGFSFSFDQTGDGDPKSITLESEYAHQSELIYQDFNFDGIKDLAIMDGRNSCYGGPSFQVYLETDNHLEHSSEFTRLAQEYCGMFQVDYDTKSIRTSTKSGCCWHQFSEFKVEDNKPVPIKIVEKSVDKDWIVENYVEKNRVGNRMTTKKYSVLSSEADIIMVYSLTFKNGKKMHLYRAFAAEDYLFYIFTDKNDIIELMYTDDFVFNSKEETLTFGNGKTTYSVYNGGILVNTPSRQIDLKASSIAENTTLSSLSELSLRNLSTE